MVWVDGARKGNMDSDLVHMEEEVGHYYDPPYAEEIVRVNALDVRPPSSNWVL